MQVFVKSPLAPQTAVIGGGINGLMVAWALAVRNHKVDLYERNALMRATSSASTKLLHGGLRYLEYGDFRLVRESLHARTWWLKCAPTLAKPLELFLPIYISSSRSRWIIGAGLTLYDLLAGRQIIERHRWYRTDHLYQRTQHLRQEGLLGAYSFFDAQMDDYGLGMWSAQHVAALDVKIHEQTPVVRVRTDGTLVTEAGERHYDVIINVTGPWAKQLLDQSRVPSHQELSLVRGSHLQLRGTLPAGFLLQVPNEDRIVFALPYQDHILLGTTEIEQTLDTPIACTPEEQAYLLDVYNRYFIEPKGPDDVIGTFAGLRPLLRSKHSATRASREYAIERRGKLLTVFGGKWTTSRALSEKVARKVAEILD